MARLTPEQQDYIVRSLACFDSPSQVVQSLREEFGITVSRQLVATYDPETRTGRKVSPKHRSVFEAARAKFLGSVQEIPIANLAVRLRHLQHLLASAEAKGNARMVVAILEQAAKEVGGAFTNRRELTGKDGKPIKTESVSAAISSVDPIEAAKLYQEFASGG